MRVTTLPPQPRGNWYSIFFNISLNCLLVAFICSIKRNEASVNVPEKSVYQGKKSFKVINDDTKQDALRFLLRV